MLRTSFVALCLFAGVHAQPVQPVQPRAASSSVVPVANCSALPNYNNATNIAGPWKIRVDGCSNGSSQGCRMEGFAAGCDVTRSADEKGIEKGAITIVDANGANTLLRCNAVLNTFEAYVPSGAGAPDWHAIGIAQDTDTAQMEWGFREHDTKPVQAYRQYVDGTPTGGILLGSEGRTTWAVLDSGSGLSNVNHQPFWFLRLLNSETEKWVDEMETRIRIDGS
ncbi:unnamed protein product [Penicillium pancosmium]